MSQLSELAVLTEELAKIVRQNRTEINALKARVSELEGSRSFRADDHKIREKVQSFNPYKQIVVDLTGIDLK